MMACRRRRAFTMIELTVTIAVLSVLLLSLVTAVQANFRLMRYNDQHSEALEILETCVKELRSLPFDAVFGSGPVELDVAVPGSRDATVAVPCNGAFGAFKEVIPARARRGACKVKVSVRSESDLTFWAMDRYGEELDVHVPPGWVKRFEVEVRYKRRAEEGNVWQVVGATTWRADLR